MKAQDEGTLTYSVAAAARLLGISKVSAYECIQRGELPALRLGRRLVVPKAALARLLESAGGPITVQHRSLLL